MAVLLTYVCDVRAAGFEDPQSQQAPSMVTSAKSNTFGDSRAAVNNASKRKWDSPRVGGCQFHQQLAVDGYIGLSGWPSRAATSWARVSTVPVGQSCWTS